jgi:hypothetical protein
MIYHQENVQVVPARFEEYLDAFQRELGPLYHDLGYRLVSCWETVASQGRWPEVVSLWEMDGYAQYAEICKRQYGDGPQGRAYRAWQRRQGALVTQTQGRILLPSSGTPTLEQMKASGRRAQVCVHETIKTTPKKAREYAEQCQRLWAPVAARHGRWMLGVYQVAWRNAEAINIWALEDWETIARYQGKIMQDEGAQTWTEMAMSLRSDWHDRLLYALPFSPV